MKEKMTHHFTQVSYIMQTLKSLLTHEIYSPTKFLTLKRYIYLKKSDFILHGVAFKEDGRWGIRGVQIKRRKGTKRKESLSSNLFHILHTESSSQGLTLSNCSDTGFQHPSDYWRCVGIRLPTYVCNFTTTSL